MDPTLLPLVVALGHMSSPPPDPANPLPRAQQRKVDKLRERERAWVEAHPEDWQRRLVLAADLAYENPEEGAWCAEARYLIEPLDADPAWIPWSQVVELRVNHVCGGEAWPKEDEARRLLDEGTWNRAIGGLGVARIDVGAPADRVHAALLEARSALHFSLGDHGAAVNDLREAIALESTPDRRLRLGLSLMPLGQEREARAQLAVGSVLDESPSKLRERARIALDVLGDGDIDGVLPAQAGLPFPELDMDPPLPDGPVVVDLWATWCGPCVMVMPLLAERAPDWAAQGVGLVGVSVDAHRSDWEHFVERRPPGYPTAWAGPAAMQQTGIQGIPTLFVLDADHRIVGIHQGWSKEIADDLERLVARVAPGEVGPE